ncbi:3'-5' exonuclease [Paenibacillus mucilaginosus]|nr:3'-5' exonuclease [Paenibacillus mucilaginosus]
MLNDVTVFDFETSGLDSKNCRVIEMAAIRCINGEIVSQFDTIVRQDFPGGLDPKIIDLTGITPYMLSTGMNELLAFKILKNLIGESLLVAHNAAFDLAFLHHSLMRLAGKTYGNSFIDTCTISRDRHVYPHKLTDMCDRYDIALSGAHRALNDVLATWDLLKALDAEGSVSGYVNRLGYLDKYGPPSWAPEHATLVPMKNRYAG